MNAPPIPFIPETAPFTNEQRAWLNGYLAGLFARTAPSAQVQSAAHNPPKSPVTVLFASQTGNAEALARQLGRRLETAGFDPEIVDAGQYPIDRLANESLLIAIASTYGEGDPPDSAKEFWTKLSSNDAPQLAKIRFAVLALGDTNYVNFCRFGRNLDERLEALGGKRLAARVDCDTDFEAPFNKWMDELLPVLNSGPAASNNGAAANGNGAAHASAAKASTNGSAASPVNTSPASFSRKNPFPARLLINRRLNGAGSRKDTRHIEISIEGSGMNYEAGDALAVQPKNRPSTVDAIIERLGCSGNEPVPGAAEGEKPLRWALLEDYEMTKIHKHFLHEMAERSGDAAFKQALDAAGPGDMARLTWGHNVYDFLAKFPNVKFDPIEFVGLLKKLHPRLYSIASSPKAYPGQVHLTVGVLRYDREGRLHKGTCSAWLAERVEPSTPVPVFVQPNKHFRPPADPSLPVIMIGPGTGIAPFRAFLQERRETGRGGKNWLFFGERNERTDFLYREELLGMEEEKLLTRLDLAFSRDQDSKVYVQHRMRENAREIFRWLEEGAHFYICGDASRMARDVHQALLEIVRTAGGLDEDEAGAYVKNLESAKRYQRDVY